MPTIEIDGRTIAVDANLTLIQAADRLDIEIPHYCYHPGLSIAGNCRMCLVEIERMPKLQIACNTRPMDGMIVRTRTPKVEAARKAVLEFLLLNHPIDCPVCDQAGECKLQDYYMDYGRYASRMPLEGKVRKAKALPIGPHVMLDQERCILCTRCVRFLDEVTHTSELGIFERGDHCVIDLSPGKTLDNPYSANVVDVCPVGALTSREFRFAARVWYLERAPSICAGCSRGCSVDVYHRRGRIFRFRPRYNPQVNAWWMCDDGRESFERYQDDRRLTQSLVRGEQGFAPAEWTEACNTAVQRLRGIVTQHGPAAVAGIVSAQSTNEEVYLFRQFLEAGIGTARFAGLAWSPADAPSDAFLIRGDRNPNREGLRRLGLGADESGARELLAALACGELRALVVLRGDLVAWLGGEAAAALEAAQLVVVMDSVASATAAHADIVLALASYLESDGTFTNGDGQVQAVHAAVAPSGESRPGWATLADLGRRVGVDIGAESAAAVFDAIGRVEGPFYGLTFAGLGRHGIRTSGTESPPAVRPLDSPRVPAG